MAQRVFVRQEFIDGGKLDANDIRCPKCGTNTLVLSGQAQIPQKEIMEEGIITERISGTYQEGSFDLQQIDCPNCDTQFLVEEEVKFRLAQQVSVLRDKLAVHEGRPLGSAQVH